MSSKPADAFLAKWQAVKLRAVDTQLLLRQTVICPGFEPHSRDDVVGHAGTIILHDNAPSLAVLYILHRDCRDLSIGIVRVLH